MPSFEAALCAVLSVILRARTRCEAQIVCFWAPGELAHHRIPRELGGRTSRFNLLWVCSACHDWIHAHGPEAQADGWLFDPERAA